MEKAKLLEAITKVKPAVTDSTLVEQANVVTFNGKEIQSYNDEILIVVPIKTEVKGSLPAKELFELLRRMGDETIKFEQKGDKVEVRGKTTKAKYAIVPTESLTVPKVKKWYVLPEDFLEGLKLCRFSAGGDDIFGNIFIKEDKIVSSDNYRMTEYIMKSKMMECLLPAPIANNLLSFNPTSFASDKNWLFFKNKDKAVFCIRRVKDKYPAVTEALRKKPKGVKITLPDELRQNLKRAEILADEDMVTSTKSISVTIKNGKVVCHGECDVGEIDETIKIDYDGKETIFNIIPALLCDILNMTNTMTVGESSLNFKTKNFQHIIQIAK